jgi:hypothetical protein
MKATVPPMVATMSAVTTIHVRALRVIGDRTLAANDAATGCTTTGDGIGVPVGARCAFTGGTIGSSAGVELSFGRHVSHHVSQPLGREVGHSLAGDTDGGTSSSTVLRSLRVASNGAARGTRRSAAIRSLRVTSNDTAGGT